MPRRRRPLLIALIALGLIVFVAISAGLARMFNADAGVRGAVSDLIRAEARGDANGMVARIAGCGRIPSCRNRAGAEARALARPGTVSFLEINTGLSTGLGGASGTARIAWEVINSTKPIVQCVRVRRTGNVLSGFRIELLQISARIKSNADCPKRF